MTIVKDPPYVNFLLEKTWETKAQKESPWRNLKWAQILTNKKKEVDPNPSKRENLIST